MRAIGLFLALLVAYSECFQVVVEGDGSFVVFGHKGFSLSSGDIDLSFNGTLYSTYDQSLRIGYFDNVHGIGIGFTNKVFFDRSHIFLA